MTERFKQIRKANGLTQAQMGESLNIAASTITAYETGNREITDRVIKDVCRLYNVNEDWLRNGAGEMFKPISAAEQVNRLMNEVIRTDGSESWQAARKTIIEALAEMPPEFWEQAAKLIDEIKNR